MPEVCAIVATSGPDRHIGYPDGRLIENDPIDRKLFCDATKNHILIVGRKTMETLPPLRDRQLLVVTTNPKWSPSKHVQLSNDVRPHWVCDSIEHALAVSNDTVCAGMSELNHDIVWIIGGNKLYESASDYIDRWYITHYPNTVISDCIETVKLSGFDPNKFDLESVRPLDREKSNGLLHIYRRKKCQCLETQLMRQ